VYYEVAAGTMKRKGDDQMERGSITKKLFGAATYRTKYHKHWQEKWPFVLPAQKMYPVDTKAKQILLDVVNLSKKKQMLVY
jgi:hypothetical protein